MYGLGNPAELKQAAAMDVTQKAPQIGGILAEQQRRTLNALHNAHMITSVIEEKIHGQSPQQARDTAGTEAVPNGHIDCSVTAANVAEALVERLSNIAQHF